MTDDFEAKARERADKINYGFHIGHRMPTAYEKQIGSDCFIGGATWAREQMHALAADNEEKLECEISYLKTRAHEIAVWHKNDSVEIERLKAIAKDHQDDWKRIQDAERECERLRASNIQHAAFINKLLNRIGKLEEECGREPGDY